MIDQILSKRRILVTGHTGFTGSWCTIWLSDIGAELLGYSLPPPTMPSMFSDLCLENIISSEYGDITDGAALTRCVKDFQPEIILHLAAQPLVRKSYSDPLETFAVNVMGTANVLEAARLTPSVRGVVCVTTDKVYKNQEWEWPYRENDPLGGKDPYSASKAAAEMVIQGYAASFSPDSGSGPWVASVRGGNIVGGGDWADDRLVPDFVRAVITDGAMTLRYPEATRPWQHVLALVHGYVHLMSGLLSSNPKHYARAWNLGPDDLRAFTVRMVLEELSRCWRRPALNFMDQPLHEAKKLALDCTLMRSQLGLYSAWNVEEVLGRTAAWYREYYSLNGAPQDRGQAMTDFTRSQIADWKSAFKDNVAG